MKAFWLVWTRLPPQVWISGMMVIHLVCGNRYKFFYYLAVFTLDLSYVALGKLLYEAPRPYMMDATVDAMRCERQFGSPSGHSSGASVFLIMMTLDIFHGTKLPNVSAAQVTFYRNCVYYPAVGFFLFYSTTLLYTRYLVAAHSLDQIIYGCGLGIWCGLTMHFLVRDHLVRHIEMLYRW